MRLCQLCGTVAAKANFLNSNAEISDVLAGNRNRKYT